jgi:pyruvate/2-oxoglutarate dehydrogenase complex dihydrolipoamide dehydrogenase (E3) component
MHRSNTIHKTLLRLQTFTHSIATMSTTTQSPGREKVSALIIGSGQAGTPLAVALANAGRRTILIERSNLGGTCVNVGCTPTKTMIASGRIAYLAGRASEYGIFQRAVGEGIAPVAEMERIRERKREIVERWRGGSEKRVAGVEELEVVKGEARFVGKKVVRVVLEGGRQKMEIEAEDIFVNVGERPAESHLPGLGTVDASRVLDSTSVMELDAVPERLIVLGGGYIGMEFGQLFARLKSKVTIVQRGKQLLPREDAEIAQAMYDICTEDGIEVLLNATAIKVSPSSPNGKDILLYYRSSDGSINQVSGSHLLIATGRTPNTDSLNLSATGIETTPRGHIIVSPTLQTSVPNVYALGDCHGGPAFTHVSYDDFRIIRANLIEKSAQAEKASTAQRENQIPYVVYTDPQLGHVGLHEAEARAKFPDKQIKTATMPMGSVARAVETAETRGLMKAVIDGKSGDILGFTCLGIEGGEVMSLVQVAMMGGLPWWRLRDAVFAHPTLAEGLNNLWGYLK